MKPRKPLKRKTPLRSHKIGQPPKPMARKPLRRVSKKRAKENKEYSKIHKGIFNGEHLSCKGCLVRFPKFIPRPATLIHHYDGRIGEKLNDLDNLIPLCKWCHDWIHWENPNEARKLGLLSPR